MQAPARTEYPRLAGVVRQLLRGKSVYRALLNQTLQGRRIVGDVLDLGSRTTESSYWKAFDRTATGRILLTDVQEGEGILCLDVEQPFPLPDESLDTVLAFNLLEHVYWPFEMPREVSRVLRPGGTFMLAVPYLHEYHPDADDFHRFSHTFLTRWLTECGFVVDEVVLLGGGPATFGATKWIDLMLPSKFKGPLVALAFVVSYPLDLLLGMRRQSWRPGLAARFALGVFVRARRPPLSHPTT